MKPVSKMKRAELEREARKRGIAHPEYMGMRDLQDWVRAKREQQS